MATLTKEEQGLVALKATVGTTTTLISRLRNTKPADSNSAEKKNDIDALDLAHDSASLIIAHSTKLSLLIINKPFTSSAITTVLRELVSGPLPGLASAVELCQPSRYTKAMSSELQWRATKVFTELEILVASIPLDGKILTDDQKNGTGSEKGKGSLANTGVVWKACDNVIALKKLGVVGLVIQKANEYRALLKDALEELQEWGDESDGDEDDQQSGDDDKEISAQDAVDNIFGSQQHIPKDDPENIRSRLESANKRLRLVILMYQAVVKRRFRTLPHLPHPELPPDLNEKSSENPGIVSCLDEVLDGLKEIPDITDELANSFYELDVEEIDKRTEECFFKGSSVAELLVKDWEGQKDDFSTWALKFQVAMKKGW
ncbi:hypothetical protein BJ878DRAFT_412006 [Calycina marina]|uniref:Cyclin-D1-binding protein 1-like N-terminal domain-containing protein n=1 Tax=Calycina marina TaxID=1763456 RepID=A0A9P8CIY9_9HELO|nr:hypothetical protein BJ878DRAFT_412006 [Calycina marina]